MAKSISYTNNECERPNSEQPMGNSHLCGRNQDGSSQDESSVKSDDPLLDVSDARGSPQPMPRPLHSASTIENARYSVNHSPRPDHANDDRHFVINEGSRLRVFAVFDGHDGSKASEFVCEYMKQFFEKHFLSKVESGGSGGSTIHDILVNAFVKTEGAFFKSIEAFIEEKRAIQDNIPGGLSSYEAYMLFPTKVSRLQELEPEISGGTTTVVAVIIGDTIHVANTGDARVVLVQKFSDGSLVTTQLSVDHTVENEHELIRLQALGLDPEDLKKTGRLGSQENTRCIGDYGIKQGYKDVETISQADEPPGIAIPNITDHKITKADTYLLLMSDGVYKSIENIQDPSSTANDTMNYLVEKLQLAEEKTPSNFADVASILLDDLKETHEKTYQKHANIDPRSPLAVQCRKRDDMTLIVYCFAHT